MGGRRDRRRQRRLAVRRKPRSRPRSSATPASPDRRQFRDRLVAAVEDDAAVGEAGDVEDPLHLVQAAVEDEAAALAFELAAHLEEEGDAGRVDEVAAFEAD